MRKTEAMKKVLSILLVFSMVLSYVPIPAFAAAEDNLCGHHTEHTADCGYVAAVAGVTCACTEVDENGTLVHTEGCGYVAAVEGRECHYACAECAAEADAPDCTCGTDDDTVHTTNCPAYAAPADPVCTCAEKCAEANVWCDVCGFDVTACTGTDTAVTYDYGVTLTMSATELSLLVDGTATLTTTVSPTAATGSVTTWTSSNTDVATVSDGAVTALSAGTTTITAIWIGTEDYDSVSATATCTVTVIDPVATLATSGGITCYETFAGAAAAATGGATLTLLDNVIIKADEAVTIPQGVTLDTKGKTITNNGTLNLPDGCDLTGLAVTGSGTVYVGSTEYKYIDGTWYTVGTVSGSSGISITASTPTTYYVCGEGFAIYDAASQKLTLNNATIETSSFAIETDVDLTIHGVGDNNIKASAASAIYSKNSNITVAGDIESITGYYKGIYAPGGNVTISDSANIGSISAQMGVVAGGTLTVGGSLGTVEGGLRAGNDLTINGSVEEIKNAGSGIHSLKGDVIISSTGSVGSITGIQYSAIVASEGDISIAGTVGLAQGNAALNTPAETGTVTITGTVLAVSGSDAAVYGTYDLEKYDGNQTFDNLIVNTGATLTIPSGETVTVNTALTNNGTIVNNGTLNLPSGCDLTGLAVTGSGTVYVGSTEYKYIDGTWYAVGTVSGSSGISITTSTPATYYACGGGYAVYDGDGTLTLYDAQINATESGKAGIWTNVDLKIVGSGNNTVTAANATAIYSEQGKLVIEGNIDTITGSAKGIYAQAGSVTINGTIGTVTGNSAGTGSNQFGIYGYDGITVTADGKVSSVTGTAALYSAGGVTISGTVDSLTGTAGSGIYAKGDVSIDGTVGTIEGTTYGICTEGEHSVAITGTTVTAKGGTGNGISAQSVQTENGGALSVNGDRDAVVFGNYSGSFSTNALTVRAAAALTIPAGENVTVTGTLINNGTIVNNGTLILPAATALADLTKDNYSGNGIVKVGEQQYIMYEGKWYAYADGSAGIFIRSWTGDTYYQCGGGYAVYDQEAKKLTLYNVEINAGSTASGIATAVPLEIYGTGTNSITGTSGIYAGSTEAGQCDITVTGNIGTITATTGNGIYSNGNITINGETESIEAQNCGILSNSQNIASSAAITISGTIGTVSSITYGAIHNLNGRIAISGNVGALSSENYAAVYALNGNITICNATVTATGKNNGIYCDGGTVSTSNGGALSVGSNGAVVYGSYSMADYDGEQSFASLTLESGAVLTIPVGETVTVTETLTNNGHIIVNGTLKLPSGYDLTGLSGSGTVYVGTTQYKYIDGTWYAVGTVSASGGISITAATPATYYVCGDGYAIYDGNGTLTLYNATVSSSSGSWAYGIQSTVALDLVLVGQNHIAVTGGSDGAAILVNGALTISGDGSLTASGKMESLAEACVYCGTGISAASLTIQSGTVTATGGTADIAVTGTALPTIASGVTLTSDGITTVGSSSYTWNGTKFVCVVHSTGAEGDKEATCVEQAYCSVCESWYGNKDSSNHSGDISYSVSGATITTNCTACVGKIGSTTAKVSSDLTYDGKVRGVTMDGDLGVEGRAKAYYSTGDGYAPVDAGTYTVRVYWVDNAGNHLHETPAVLTYTIVPASLSEATVTLTPAEYIYDGTEKKPDVTVTLGSASAGGLVGSGNYNTGIAMGTSKTLTAGKDYTVSYSDNKDAGTATVTVTGMGNYSGTTTGTFTIKEAAPVIAWAEAAQAVTYTGVAAQITAPAVTLVNGETFSGEISYSYRIAGSDDEFVTGLPVKVQAYEIKASIEASGNYTAVESTGYLTLTISKAAPSYTVPEGLTATYGDTLTKVPLPDGFTWDDVTQSVGNAGSNTFKATYTPSDTENYNTVADIDVSVTVGTADPKYTVPTGLTAAHGDTLTYNGEAQALITAGSTADGTMMYKLDDGEWSETIPTAKNAGSYTVSYCVKGDSNHNDTEPVSITVEIQKANLTITAKDNTITYGDEPSAAGVTCSGFVGNETESVLGGELAYAYSYAQYGGVGSYTITPGGLTSGNYEIKYAAGKLTVNAKAVTITAKDQTITYGGAISGSEYSVTGLIDGHTAAVTLTPSTKNVTANGTITASVAKITSGGEDVTANYAVSYAAGTLVIQPDTLKISGLTTDNVTSANESDITAVLDSIKNADSTKAEWDAAAGNCEELLQQIAAVKAEIDAVTKAVDAITVTEENVTSADKEALQEISDALKALLDSKNLTEQERTDLTADKAKVDSLLDVIEKTAGDSKAATDTIENLDGSTVTSDDKAGIEQALEAIEALLKGDNLTEEERKSLEETKAKGGELIGIIDAAASAIDTENTKKVEDVTAENVKPEDKGALEKAKADLEKALADKAGNYTEEEKKAIQDEIQRIEDAIEAIENAEEVTEAIIQLPETVEPDDAETAEKILDVKTSYDGLTDHEKSMVDETAKEKLDDLVAALTDYRIIKGDGSKWTKGSGKTLSFTANGPFGKFVGIAVDGKKVSTTYYTAGAGSTIVTLKASFLKRLSVGKHTITVLYTDGEAEGSFKITEAAATPATGDNFNIGMWAAVMCVSTLGLVVLLVDNKRRRPAK